jgi:catechol 2,3-dioxygenase-like lactoylglutathione lyase family enzyme
MNVQFISTFAVICPDLQTSRKLYVDSLGLPLTAGEGDEYMHSDQVDGVRHFGLWPLHEAAEACFGTGDWPTDRARPQASIEFDVGSPEEVASAAGELEQAGFELLHSARREPWGQTVARVISSEGLIVGISYIPSMHE